MASNNKLGTVGIVRPTARSGGFEDLLRMLPEGIAVAHTCLTVQRGTVEEFKKVIQQYEEKVAEMAEAKVDVVNPSGAPPFMVLGYDGRESSSATGRRNTKSRYSPRARA
jgi:maleate cis-trans isomerase